VQEDEDYRLSAEAMAYRTQNFNTIDLVTRNKAQQEDSDLSHSVKMNPQNAYQMMP